VVKTISKQIISGYPNVNFILNLRDKDKIEILISHQIYYEAEYLYYTCVLHCCTYLHDSIFCSVYSSMINYPLFHSLVL